MQLVDLVRESVIGDNEEVEGPYGKKLITYADYTASGKALGFIEEYISQQVLPLYGNSHTQTSKTGRQTTLFMEEARTMIKDYTGCTKKDALVFVGSGCTAAANRLVQMLGLSASSEVKDVLQRDHPDMCRTVVFVSSHEHHSNLLPWRESLAEVVCIPDDPCTGNLSLVALEACLVKYADRPLKIGAFSAASNVTGIVEDVDAVSILLHRHGALAVWDYACSGPYVEIDMNARVEGAHTGAHKDAVFISPHKFVGGPQTPGVLIFKKELSGRRDRCSLPGGGSVFYVSSEEHVYLRHCEEREEAGTPALVGAIRCGLAFQLKHRIGCYRIAELDDGICQRVLSCMARHPSIHVLGSTSSRRLPIVSFMVHCQGMYLHYNYVCALLNDLFGIQVRGGCMCAGPYSQELLGIAPELSGRFLRELRKKEDNEVIRPGYVRLSLHYSMSESTVGYVLQAVGFVASEGWRLLPQYTFDARTGLWMHRHNRRPARSWLHGIDYDALMGSRAGSGAPSGQRATPGPPGQCRDEVLAGYLSEARAQAEVAGSQFRYGSTSLAAAAVLPAEAEELRWFLMPAEALQLLHQGGGHELGGAAWRAPFVARGFGAAAGVRGAEAPPGAGCPAPAGGADHPGAGAELDADLAEFALQLQGQEEEEEDEQPAPALEHEARAGAAAAAELPRGSASGGPAAALHPLLPPRLYDAVVEAVLEHRMIESGDRVLLALSGGKDSLTLLHVLHRMSCEGPVRFELAAATVDPMAEGFDPSPLIPYLKKLDIPYFYERQDIIGQARGLNISYSSEVSRPNPHRQAYGAEGCASPPASEGHKPRRSVHSICAFCSRMKRGVLYGCARKNAFNVLAMAQHLDDLAESFVMSVFHNGFLRTMKANYTVAEGDLRVIRPLINVREQSCNEYADAARLPVINENCPACFEAPRERYRTKCLLASQEHLFPNLFSSLQKCIRPLMEADVESYLREKDSELSSHRTAVAPGSRWRSRKQCRRSKQQQGDQPGAQSDAGAVVALRSEAHWDGLLARAGRAGQAVVAKFGAEWCAPCRELDPLLARLSAEGGSAVFATVDVDAVEALAERYRISALPTVKLFLAAEEVASLAGPTEARIREALEATRPVR